MPKSNENYIDLIPDTEVYPTDMKTNADFVRYYQKKGMTQEKAARALGYSNSGIAKMSANGNLQKPLSKQFWIYWELNKKNFK